MSPRPKSEHSKQLRFEMRMGAETAEKLMYCAEKRQQGGDYRERY